MFAASKSGSVDAKDAQFKNVTMLLHGNGTNGAQNNTFLDSSTNNFTITRNGNTTQGTFSPYGSNWSNYFNGSSSFLTMTGSAATNFSGVDWTVETWVYVSATPVDYQYIIQSQTGANNWKPYLGIALMANGTINCAIDANNYTSTQTITFNTWNHLALVRNSGVVKLYINGVASSVSVTSDINNSNLSFWFGKCDNSPGGGSYIYYLNGYLSNTRFVKGTAVYTSNFTPSTTPLTAITNTQLLTCQSNRFIDNSSNNFTVTPSGSPSVQRFSPFSPTTAYSTSVIGGSGYFDGSGDYLVTPSSALVSNFSADFTIEGWVYLNATTAYGVLIGGNGSNGWYIEYGSARGFGAYDGSSFLNGSSTAVTNQWVNFAVTRASGTVRFFINGTLTASTSSANFNYTQSIGIGAYSGGSSSINGYLSNVRINNSTALYTASFTPSTAPLTAVSGTSLLLSTTNAGILDNAMMNDLETVGNAQISTSVKKYGTGSMYFDGTGDGLQAVGTPNTVFGTGDFTVEFWIYLNANTGTFKKFIELGTTGSCFTIETQGTSNVLTVTDLNNTVFLTSSSALSLTTWVHVAVTRSGSTLKLFQDGTQVGSATNSTNFANSGSVYIGQSNSGQAINAYMDDLRITKGYARYTANFTPPTAAFADKG